MRLIGREILLDFAQGHAEARGHIKAWVKEVESSTWSTPHDIKQRYPTASILAENQVVFNIKGNSYRILTVVAFNNGIVQVLRIGTHSEYDSWNL